MSKPLRELRADGEATRARILEAAGELFATQGFAGNRSSLYRSVLTEAHHRLVNLTDLQQLTSSDLPAPAKLKVLLGQLVVSSQQEPRSWHLLVLAREVLAPSSHLHVVFENVALPKVLLVRQMLSDITGISVEDPALTRCMLSVGAPCMMLLVGGRAYPGAMQDVSQMSAEIVTEHLYQFAMGGLKAVGKAYNVPHNLL